MRVRAAFGKARISVVITRGEIHQEALGDVSRGIAPTSRKSGIGRLDKSASFQPICADRLNGFREYREIYWLCDAGISMVEKGKLPTLLRV